MGIFFWLQPWSAVRPLALSAGVHARGSARVPRFGRQSLTAPRKAEAPNHFLAKSRGAGTMVRVEAIAVEFDIAQARKRLATGRSLWVERPAGFFWTFGHFFGIVHDGSEREDEEGKIRNCELAVPPNREEKWQNRWSVDQKNRVGRRDGKGGRSESEEWGVRSGE